MNTIRGKRQFSILKSLERIEQGEFTEADIKNLLLDLRENTPKDSFTRELGDFVAHDVRERGLCHQELDFRVLVIGGPPHAAVGKRRINLFLMPKPVFDILQNTALKRIDETALVAYTGFDRKAARKFFETAYVFDKKQYAYAIKSVAYAMQMQRLVNLLTSTLYANPVISASGVINQLNRDVKAILKAHMPGTVYRDAVLRQADDIMVCILCLFHDIEFKFYDGSRGRFVLTEAFEPPVLEADRPKPHGASSYYQHKFGMILSGECPIETLDGATLIVRTTVIETALNVLDYADVPLFAGDPAPITIHDIQAIRDANKRLRITPYPD